MQNLISIIGKIKSLLLIFALLSTNIVYAINTTPRTLIYEGVIYNNSNTIEYPINLRFSFWKDDTINISDIISGDINPIAPNYSGYYEIQNVTPNSNGEFLTYIGIVNPLPDLNSDIHKYYQVEYKKSTDPNTAYKIIDIYGSPNIQRKALNTVPYAQNADMIDNSEIGTGSGNIPLLGSGGKLSSDKIPNYINEQQFTINNLNQAGDIKIIFGQQNNKVIKWNASGFEIGDSLKVWGNLTVTGSGSFNGRDVDTYFDKLDTVDTGATKYSQKVEFSDSGYVSTNVKDAILETKQLIEINTGPVFSWMVLPGTTDNFKNRGYDKSVGFTMPKSGELKYISVNTDPSNTSANGDYVITKQDGGEYNSSLEMTRISMDTTGAGDGPNSAYSTNLQAGLGGLTFSAGNILRAYHVGSTDKNATLSLGVSFNNNVPYANVIIHSMLCDAESYLPNWGGGGPDITSDVAQNYVNNSNGHCVFDSNVNFQIHLGQISNPGDNTGESPDWTTFGPTGIDGKASYTVLNPSDYSLVWVREVYQSINIPFSGAGGGDYSAELECHTDALNYDNYDQILALQDSVTYYCVAFNVRNP